MRVDVCEGLVLLGPVLQRLVEGLRRAHAADLRQGIPEADLGYVRVVQLDLTLECDQFSTDKNSR